MDASHASSIGGILVPRYSRTAEFTRSLPPDMAFQLRVWRIIHGPIEQGDRLGHAIHFSIQAAVVGFIMLVIMETEAKVYNKHMVFMHHAGVALASVLSLEYLMSLWAVMANEPFASGHWVTARLSWACTFFPVMDLVVLASFWSNEVLRERGLEGTYAHRLVGMFQTLRLLRLLRVFDLFEGGRVQKAFSMLVRVIQDKGSLEKGC